MNFLSNSTLNPPAPAGRSWQRTLGFGTAIAVLAFSAHAQGSDNPSGAIGALPAEQPAPRYAAGDLSRAFGFMDGNADGKVSRQEAAGFRGVAKNFDRADTDHDGFLSREEFDTAMNHVKPQ